MAALWPEQLPQQTAPRDPELTRSMQETFQMVQYYNLTIQSYYYLLWALLHFLLLGVSIFLFKAFFLAAPPGSSSGLVRGPKLPVGSILGSVECGHLPRTNLVLFCSLFIAPTPLFPQKRGLHLPLMVCWGCIDQGHPKGDHFWPPVWEITYLLPPF